MSDENIESMDNSVESSLKELKAAIENPESLSYSDIMNEMNVAYKVIGIVSSSTNLSEEKRNEISQEVSGIMNKLGDIAKVKKAEENEAKVKEEQKLDAFDPVPTEPDRDVRDVHAEDENNVGMEYEKPKEERTIPKPVFEDEIVAEATVTSAKSSVEPTEEQILSAFVKEPQTVVNAVQVNVEVTESKEESKPYTTISPVKEEPAPEEMIIETPKTDEAKIIVPEDEEHKDEPEKGLDYSFLENKPFEGDEDDDEVMSDEELNKLEFEDKPSDKELRSREIEKAFSAVPDGMEMLPVKTVSRKKVSETLKALQNIKTEGLNIDQINMFDFDGNDEIIRREYLKTRNDMIANPKISRIALLMSGHYEEISAYGNYDLVSIERHLLNDSESFVDKEMLMLNSIYEHIKYVSYSSQKPSFEEWAKNIMYPDIASLYFGVYDANSVGDNNYSFGCPHCGQAVDVARKNKDLTVAVPKELTQDKLEKFITNKDIMKVDSTEYAKSSKNTIVRVQLPHSKIIVDFAIPTLYDYIVVLNTAQRISQRDLGGTLDLSAIDIFNAEGKEEDATRILAYLYIKAIGIPAKVDGTNKFRYIRLTNKADIIEHVNGLDLDDYNALLAKNTVQELIVRTSTRYYIEDVKCTNPDCGKTIKYINLDPKQIFFFKIGEEKSRLMI